MRKVDIRARVQELDQQLQRRKATLVQQQDERRQLIQQCATAGDHVYSKPIVFMAGSWEEGPDTCEFCGHTSGISQGQLARNLVAG